MARCIEEDFLCFEPLALEIVAGGVPAEDTVHILDLSLEREPENAHQETLRRFQPDLVGYTGYSTHAHIVRRLAHLARSARPGVLTVVGGVHATMVPHDYATEAIDFIVRGEGGTAMRYLVRSLKKGTDPGEHPAILLPRRPDFLRRAEAPPPPFPNFAEVPRPRRQLVDRTRYFCIWTAAENGRLKTMFPGVAVVRTSVGCAFKCSFCTVPYMTGNRYVERTPEDVVEELEALQETHVYFVDDEMFLNERRARRIAELLRERGIRKRYISWARSDTIVRHPEVFRLWREVGLDIVYVGLEAMSQDRLVSYQKHTSVEINRQAVALLRQWGITLHASLLVDPDFTVEQFRELEGEIRWLAPAEITFTVMSPAPGTPLWHQNRRAFICDPYRFYDCMHTLLPTRLPLRKFYAHFSRLYSLALRRNPLRVHRVKIPIRELIRAIVGGTRWILAIRAIHNDYRHHEYR